MRGKQRDQWLQVALSNSRDAYRFSNRVSKALEFTERNAPYTPETAATLDAVRKEYFHDWPVCLTWVPSALRQDRVAMEQYADDVATYAISEYSVIDWLLRMPAAATRHERLRKSMQGRFAGEPRLATDQAAVLLSNFQVRQAEQLLRDHVAARPMGIGPYWSLAELLIAQGRHRDASEMFLAYPGFAKDSGADRVALSSYAGDIAWLWWPIGQFEYARPFFERSAAYKTGSGYSLQSAALLALDDGDPNTAAKLYMDIARRYSSLDRLSDYFDLIFALGRPEEAWRTYDETYRDGNAGRVLASIMSGVRVLGWTDSQTIEWLSNDKNAALADGTYFHAPRAALAASIMDRELPADLPGVLQKFSAPSPYQFDKERRKVVRRTAAGAVPPASPQVCGPSRYGAESAAGFQIPERIDSHLVYFATGYQALDQARYADAFNAFDTATRLFESYGTGCESVAYMLPYLALAAGKVKNTRALDEYLQAMPYHYREFNYQLALATLSALRAQHDQASGYFEAALNRWSGSDGALPPAYIYADVLERLYKETKAEVYRERLLHWAKVRQRVAPSSGWAYAKEYRYTRNAADRERALGMALYLDRRSVSLRGMKPAEAAAAQSNLAARNPFLAWRRPAK